MICQSIKRQQGLSLIELMIAVVLGIFVTGGIIQLFTNSQQTYRIQENLSRLQENARFAMNIITRDIRMADYSGCTRNSINNASNSLDTSHAGYALALHGFSQSIVGTNGRAGISLALDDPDSITIRAAFDSGITVQAPYGPITSSNVSINAGSSLAQGDIILISDCTHADIFQISNSPGTSIAHTTGGASTPGNLNSVACPAGGAAHCLSKVYRGDASIFNLTSNVYTIQMGAGGSLALRRNGAELIEGIENMQILYGEDTDNDNAANYYVAAGTAGLDFDNVVSIRISLLATTLEDNLASQPIPYTIFGDTVTPADRRIRRVFTSTIALRNRLL